MSGSSRPIIREIPRLLLLLLGWILYCRWLTDVLPPWWAWTAFAVIYPTARAVARSGLRFLPGIAAVIVAPLLVRLVASPLLSVMLFDNGWLLTAPYLWFTALATFLNCRAAIWKKIETPLFLIVPTLLLGGDSLTFPELSVPAATTLRLSLAVLALLLSVLNFAVADLPTRTDGKHKKIGRRDAGGTIVHSLVLLASLVLLLWGGLEIRGENALKQGGGVLAGDLFRFDFNDVLSLEPEISLNAELTMLYREDGSPKYRYLRRFTLSGWDDVRGFFRDGEKETDIPGRPAGPEFLPRGPVILETGDLESREEVKQEYYLIALDPTSLFGLNMPVEIEPWIIWDDSSFSRAYGVSSQVSYAGPWELLDAGTGSLDGKWLDYYLEGGGNDEYRHLALEVVKGAVSDWEKASTIERWFHNNYYYSLNPGVAPDGDQLGYFLFETRRGYCSYYAFAMTRMCRSLGIPARVAVGFVTDPESSVLGFVPVRSDQAHAWVEVWLDDYGWIEFDPTSQAMAPGEEYPFQFINPEQWLPLVEEVLSRSGEIDVALPAEEDEATTAWWRGLVRQVADRPTILPVVILLLLVAVYLPWRIVPFVRLLVVSLGADPRRRCLVRWRYFACMLTRTGLHVGAGDTVLAWADRVESNGLAGFREWSSIYLKAVYSPAFGDDDAVDASEAESTIRALYRRLPGRLRLTAFLKPGLRRRLPW